MESNASVIAEKLKFRNFANFLNKSIPIPSGRKLDHLIKYFEFVRRHFRNLYGTLDSAKAGGDSIYCLARILLPNHDRKRAAYKTKTATLGRMFCTALGVDEKSTDGEKLLKFKEADKDIGDFPNVVYSIMQTRSSKSNEHSPSFKDLHDMLDKFAKTDGVTADDQRRLLQKFITYLTPMEGKWLSKILLKRLDLGLSQQQLFSLIHPQAYRLYEEMKNLEAVCLKLNDPGVKLEGNNIMLFQSFTLMSCARLNTLEAGNSAEDAKGDANSHKNTLTLPSPPFLVETKYDGERFAVHYDSTKPKTERFKFFSRQGVDYTQGFRENLMDMLEDAVKPECTSFIMDGEMMVYNRKEDRFIQKGSGRDVKKLKPLDPDVNPLYIAFDIVYYNGKQLTELPIEKRLEILNQKVCEPLPGVFNISKTRTLINVEEVEDALNDAIDRMEEGIVVKELGSTYIGKRHSSWLKIKPENIDGTSVADLDVVILGAFYSDSSRSKEINHFLTGILDNSKGPGNEAFWPLARVGSGHLTHTQLTELVRELKPRFVKTFTPAHKIHWQPSDHRPVYWIDPKRSVVLQIKASEITESSNCSLKYTLRFPRTTQIRRDKTWREIMTIKEFHDLRESTGGKLARRSDGLTKSLATMPSQFITSTALLFGCESTPPRRYHGSINDDDSSIARSRPVRRCTRSNPGKSQPITPPSNRNTPTMRILISNTFDSKEFYVVGTDDWKLNTASLISEHGGKLVATTKSPMLFAVVAETLTARVSDLSSGAKYDILKFCWVEKCIRGRKIVDIRPGDYWFVSKKTQASLDNNYDRFGNGYLKNVSSLELRQLLQKIEARLETEEIKSAGEQGSSSDDTLDDSGMDFEVVHEASLDQRKRLAQVGVENLDAEKLQKFHFFQDCTIFLFGESKSKNMLEASIQFYGGKISDTESHEDVTHIVVLGDVFPKKVKACVVNLKWLEDSLEEKQLVDQLEYVVRC